MLCRNFHPCGHPNIGPIHYKKGCVRKVNIVCLYTTTHTSIDREAFSGKETHMQGGFAQCDNQSAICLTKSAVCLHPMKTISYFTGSLLKFNKIWWKLQKCAKTRRSNKTQVLFFSLATKPAGFQICGNLFKV